MTLGLPLSATGWAQAPDRQALMDRILQSSLPADEPGAAVLVLEQGRVLLRQARGLADLESREPLRVEQLFRIGSMSKPFTALAVLQLMDQGKLNLQDTIGQHLPDYPAVGRDITLMQLLTHQAGLPDYTVLPSFRAQREAVPNTAALLAHFQGEPLAFVPGERFGYSNSHYVVLGAVIEKLSGLPYGRFMAQHCFSPLGLRDTGLEDPQVHAVVKGYGRRQGQRLQAPTPPSANTHAAGGLVSTIDDLARFAAAVDAGRLLKPQTWEIAFRAVPTRDGQPTRYGLGWQVQEFMGQPRVQHGGALAGFSSHLLRLPEQGIWVVVLMNDGPGRQPGPGYIAEQLAAVALGQAVDAPQAVVVDAAQLAAVVGVYGAEQPQRAEFRVVQGRLMVQVGSSRLPLEASGPLEFFARRSTLVRFRFERDESGKVSHVVLQRAGMPEDRLARSAPGRAAP